MTLMTFEREEFAFLLYFVFPFIDAHLSFKSFFPTRISKHKKYLMKESSDFFIAKFKFIFDAKQNFIKQNEIRLNSQPSNAYTLKLIYKL